MPRDIGLAASINGNCSHKIFFVTANKARVQNGIARRIDLGDEALVI